ncbi:MAG TPA: ATP-binding protein [Candidatus Sulfotelmatobacter sp.]
MHRRIRSAFRLSNLSIRSCLIASFVLIVLLMVAADAVAIWQYWQIEALAQRVRKTEQLADAVVRIHLDVYSFRDKMVALASSHDIRQFSVEAAEIRRSFVEQVDHTEQMLRATPDIEQDAHVSYALESLRVTLLSQLDTAVQLATAGEWNAVQLRAAIEIPALIQFSSSLVEKVDQQALEKRNEASENVQKARQHLYLIVPIAALLTLLAAAALGWYVTRIVTGPLSELTGSAEALARGDFQHKVQLHRNNELAVLGNTFNYAAQQLQKLYEDLRRSERELRDVIEAMPTMVWIARTDGSNEFGNRRWQEYTGLSHERTFGPGWQDAVYPTDLKQHWEKWCASLASGEPFENEVRYRRAADGEYRWFLSRAVPLRDEHGKILRWYGVSTDIEDRKRAEEERERLRADLAHVNRVSMLGELAASVSHELKQPIAAAMTNAKTCMRWLKRDQPDVDEALEATSRIVNDGTRATEIIERLRSLYKMSPPQRELVEVNEIIREMGELLRAEANQYAVSIRTDLATDLPKAGADRVQLQQVFMNLMLNAIEAMKETGGVLTVKTQLGENGQLLISVSDTGVGLPKDKIEQIFDAFVTTKPQGSGMGLSISRSIVESHGGHLWATANNGRGATFHFTLPTATETMRMPAIGT